MLFVPTPAICATEDQECIAFCDWASCYPVIGQNLVHVPNEAVNNKILGRKLKRMGVKAGFPDYFLFVPRGTFHGLAIEMKRITEKGKKLRPEQQKWLERLSDMGYCTDVCYGCSDAIQTVERYLKNT